MAEPHAFLDILANAQVRDAYLAGRMTLILSADLETVLWANGAGARFIGFGAVAEALQAVCGFSALTRRSLRSALGAGVSVSIPGIEGARDFLADEINLAPWGQAVFLRSTAAAKTDGTVNLTEGLSDDDAEAALVDIEGRLMAAEKGFDAAILAAAELPPLLAEAYRDGEVKKRFIGAERPYPVGVLRLNEKPPVFLLIAAKKPAESSAAAAAKTFRFNPQTLPARFVWQSDAAGVFTEISPELARCVGAACADIAGKSFTDLAKQWKMDKDGAVRALLQSGHSWAGQALSWPVEGQAARVRVALSALPLYSADKKFLGFRGFGVIEQMTDETGDVMGEDKTESRNLSSEEQEAFSAIARELQNGALPGAAAAAPVLPPLPPAVRSGAEQMRGGQVPGFPPLPPLPSAPPPAQTDEDVFAALGAEVRIELEKEAKLQAERARALGAQAALAAQKQAQELAQPAEAALPTQQAERIKALEAELSALRRQADKQNFLLNAISESVLAVDKSGQIILANEAAARLFGYRPSELSGKALSLLFSAASARDLYQDIERAELEKAGMFLRPGREAEGKNRAGEAKKLRLNFGCLQQGESYFLLMRDMTRFHDIIAALLRKNHEEAEEFRRQTRRLALISHEIRTPFAALLGMAQFMAAEKAGPLDNKKYKDYLGDMLRAGDHIMTLINDILQGGRKKAEWPKMDIRPLPLLPVLNETLALMIPQANAANIIIRSGVAADLPPVLADARAVKQILLNLLANSIRFTGEGGQIVISAHMLPSDKDNAQSGGDNSAAPERRPEQRIMLRISDTGIGMSEREIARSERDPLSAEFKEEGAAAAPEQEAGAKSAGAGLGLPMVRALAAANNIIFSLSSEQGKGTAASLAFAAAEREEESENG